MASWLVPGFGLRLALGLFLTLNLTLNLNPLRQPPYRRKLLRYKQHSPPEFAAELLEMTTSTARILLGRG